MLAFHHHDKITELNDLKGGRVICFQSVGSIIFGAGDETAYHSREYMVRQGCSSRGVWTGERKRDKHSHHHTPHHALQRHCQWIQAVITILSECSGFLQTETLPPRTRGGSLDSEGKQKSRVWGSSNFQGSPCPTPRPYNC